MKLDMPPILLATQCYMDMLTSFDYEKQNATVASILSSFSPSVSSPLFSSRFKLRAMTPEDIAPCAHLIVHSFGTQGLLNQALRLPFSTRINEWIARLRVCLCDHLCFVIEDTENFEKKYTTENDNGWCNCQDVCPLDLLPSSSSSSIVSLLITHDLASRVSSLPASFQFHRSRTVRGFLNQVDNKRIDRIREEANLILSKAEIKEREEKEKEDKEKNSTPKISAEIPHHFERERDNKRDNEKTMPKSGEGLDVWVLATRPTHQGYKLASYISQFLVEYVKRETKFKFMTLEAAHPATEKIWTSEKIGARVMSRMKTKDYEFADEDGTIIYPFASIEYDMCCLDVDLN